MRSGIRFGWITIIPWMGEEGRTDDEIMYDVVGMGEDVDEEGKDDEDVIVEILENIGIDEIVCL